MPTLAEACETLISIHAGSWKPNGKNEQNWRSTMRDYAFPRLGDMPVDAVTGADVMAVLLPIWTAKTETAGRVRRRISAARKWAVAQGHRTDNSAGDALIGALPNNNAQVTHRAALPHSQVGATPRCLPGYWSTSWAWRRWPPAAWGGGRSRTDGPLPNTPLAH